MLSVIKTQTQEKKEHKGEKLVVLEARQSELKSELSKIDTEKRRIAENNKKLESDKGFLEKQISLVAEEVARFAKETKGIKVSKSATSQVLEKKIASLETELKTVHKENQRMRDEIDLFHDRIKAQEATTVNARKFELFGTDDDDFDRAVAVKARPKLFGEKD